MKKIFVSHSSQDKETVDIFIDKILKLGLRFSSEDIAYTSREDTGVRVGHDIKQFIKDNISGCDFVFFMISDNYAKSQICLNEMGAAWATDRVVIPIVLPNTGFDTIGWLYNVHKGIKLDDTCALDTLFEEVNEKYDHKLKVSAWNIYKTEFLNSINGKALSSSNKIVPIIEEELDLLDCREIFDENIQLHTECMGRLTVAANQATENINRNTKNLTNLTNNPNATTAQARTILLKFAHDYDALSNVYDQETPLIKEYFEKAINAAIKMRDFSSFTEEEAQNEREAITGMIEATEELLESTIEGKTIFENDKTNLDKNLSKSRKRLIACYDRMIETLGYCINKANELLNYT